MQQSCPQCGALQNPPAGPTPTQVPLSTPTAAPSAHVSPSPGHTSCSNPPPYRPSTTQAPAVCVAPQRLHPALQPDRGGAHPGAHAGRGGAHQGAHHHPHLRRCQPPQRRGRRRRVCRGGATRHAGAGGACVGVPGARARARAAARSGSLGIPCHVGPGVQRALSLCRGLQAHVKVTRTQHLCPCCLLLPWTAGRSASC